MSEDKTLLVVDAGAGPLEDLALHLREQRYRVVRVKTMDEGVTALRDPRYAVAAAVVPPDLPALDLERAIVAFRSGGAAESLPLLAAGQRPDADLRARLRRTGVEYALWRPVDEHTLRFQINRALAGGDPLVRSRDALRVPTPWPVRIRSGRRDKTGRVYTVSEHGAFLATARPSLPQSTLHFNLPLPGLEVRIAARVVMTNVPGNLEKKNLPIGMGVRFTGHSAETEEALRAFATERAEMLRV